MPYQTSSPNYSISPTHNTILNILRELDTKPGTNLNYKRDIQSLLMGEGSLFFFDITCRVSQPVILFLMWHVLTVGLCIIPELCCSGTGQGQPWPRRRDHLLCLGRHGRVSVSLHARPLEPKAILKSAALGLTFSSAMQLRYTEQSGRGRPAIVDTGSAGRQPSTPLHAAAGAHAFIYPMVLLSNFHAILSQAISNAQACTHVPISARGWAWWKNCHG